MTTDECARIEELISAQQDGATTPEERAQIERHVAGCARCQATVAAFGQVDRQVRRYLMATPVPEIATPWRTEPIPLPVRRGGGLGHWRVTAVGLAAIFVMLFTAAILAFQPLNTAPSQTAGGRPPAESASGGAPGAAQVAATSTSATAFGAPMAPAQPTAAAARGAAGSAAPSSAPSSAASSAPAAAATRAAASSAPSSAPAAAATATQGSSAAITGAPTSTRAAAPAAGAVTATSINPAQLLRLGEATELTICRPGAGWCDTQPRTAAEQAAIVAALDRALPRLAPPIATGSDQYVIMRFRFVSGEERVLAYHYGTQRLTLPGDVDVQGSPELASLLAGVVTPR